MEQDLQTTPKPIDYEKFEDVVFVSKENFRLGVGNTSIEMEAAIAMLNWFIKAAISLPEAEHTRDIIQVLKYNTEGR